MTNQKTKNVSEHRAWQIFPLLVSLAKIRATITYEGLSLLLGYSQVTQAVGNSFLPLIDNYCISQKIPRLTSIVVLKHEGEPGDGLFFPAEGMISPEQEKVFEHQWTGSDNSYPADFKNSEVFLNYRNNAR